MSLISYAIKGNLKRFDNNLKKISKKEKRSMMGLRFNFLKCFWITGCGYSDYLNYELYKRTRKELKEYVTIKDQDKFYEIVSPSKYKETFTVKPTFLKTFKKYIGRDFFDNGSREELEEFLTKHEVFMYKPKDGLGGHGVEKMYSKDIKNHDDFYEKLKTENAFLDEYVIQNKKISKICSASVNTIRLMTFSYNGKSEILYAAMRFGNGKNAADNFHQGGMGVLVDIETGKLVGKGFNKNLEYFEKHPSSGIKFDGFQIPNWEYIKKMTLDAALISDKIHFVGWDVAVTEEGATFIEGNRRPGFDMVQVLDKRGRKDMMRYCLNIINENEGTNYKI